jgi:hypothetical protein
VGLVTRKVVTAFFLFPHLLLIPRFATLVIYREKGFTGSAFDHEYYVNDELVAKLGTGTYTYLKVKPGNVRVQWGVGRTLLSDGKREPIEIECLPGRAYYYREGLTTTSVIPVGPLIVIPMKGAWGFIDPNAATHELAEYRLVKPIVEVLE